MEDDDWDDFPVILGFGGINELSDDEPSTPRLAGMRSVSEAAARAQHRPRAKLPRQAGFAHHLVGSRTRDRKR